MRRYYFIDSCGAESNLQLYALKQAKLQWSALQQDLAEHDSVEHFHERCVFLICTIGLSVSQLLGQNNPDPSERVPSPATIFASIVKKHRLDAALNDAFREFIDTYDHCRHFGLTSDGGRHWQVSQVTLAKTEKVYRFGLLVWETLVEIFRRDPRNDLEELRISDVENDL